MGKGIFPTIDISKVTSKYTGSSKDLHLDADVQAISKEIVDGFTKFGFIFIKGHNIEENLIEKVFKISKSFFTLDTYIKNKFNTVGKSDRKIFTKDSVLNWGYVPFKVETFEKSRPYDLKECFNVFPFKEKKEELELVCPQLWTVSEELYQACSNLSYILMKIVNIALHTDDPNFLYDRHQHYGDVTKNPTTLRLLYYPSIDCKENVLDNQLRCGEHADYGTFTLLFQDDAGGLQVGRREWAWLVHMNKVVSPSGQYVDVVPMPGCIVVNAADMLEIWSGHRFKSTRHRVIVPTTLGKPRQSMAFFVNPNNDAEVFDLEKNNREDAINPHEYLMKKCSETY